MGSLLALAGPAIGAAGALFGGSQASNAALSGYNYLTGNATNTNAQNVANATAPQQLATQNTEAQLLGTQPMTSTTQNGFNNYLNSTGYNFQKQQGGAALTGSAAARGILNSGSAAKGLTQYGQNLAGTAFNGYLSNLSGLNSQQQGAINTGVTASGQVGSAGTQGGATAAGVTQTGITGAAGAAAGLANQIPNNYFGLSGSSNGSLAPISVTPNQLTGGY